MAIFSPLCKMMPSASREKQFYAPLTLNIYGVGVAIVSNPASLEVVFCLLVRVISTVLLVIIGK